jgi:hypothetical protein
MTEGTTNMSTDKNKTWTNKQIDWLRRELRACERIWANQKDDFLKRLDEHPLESFEWGMNTVTEAARVKVARELQFGLDSMLEKDMTPEEIRRTLLKVTEGNANRFARWPSRSSSPMANLTHQEEGAAWANWIDWFRNP